MDYSSQAPAKIVADLLNENKWDEVIDLYKHNAKNEFKKLQWVWPNLENFRFIENYMLKNGSAKMLISIGCGCGLLERIFQEITGISVMGYEVNKTWWDNKYSNPQFIRVEYREITPSDDDENQDEDVPFFLKKKNNKRCEKVAATLPEDSALLFCYFNDGNAFKKYISEFKGNLVFIIGPGKNAGRHTNPQPFSADFGDKKWILIDSTPVRNSDDFIAVYVKE